VLLGGGWARKGSERNRRSPPLLAGKKIGAESPTPAEPGIRPRLCFCPLSGTTSGTAFRKSAARGRRLL